MALDFLGFKSRPAEADELTTSVGNEIPPEPNFDDSDNPVPVEHACVECGKDVQYKGRGRVPTRCPDCRSTRTSGASEGPASRAPRMANMDKRKAKIVGNLLEINGILAGSVVMAAPVTGHNMVLNAPPAISSFVEIAAKYPRMLDGLEKLTDVMPWVEVGRFAGSMAYAVAVDTGRLQPYGLVAEYLGVANAAQAAHYEPPQEEPDFTVPQPATVGVTVASPNRFVMPDGA